MTKKEADKKSGSERDQEHAAMLETALSRPGVREVMQVYGGWQERDRELYSCRTTAEAAGRFTTTDRSNPL